MELASGTSAARARGAPARLGSGRPRRCGPRGGRRRSPARAACWRSGSARVLDTADLASVARPRGGAAGAAAASWRGAAVGRARRARAAGCSGALWLSPGLAASLTRPAPPPARAARRPDGTAARWTPRRATQRLLRSHSPRRGGGRQGRACRTSREEACRRASPGGAGLAAAPPSGEALLAGRRGGGRPARGAEPVAPVGREGASAAAMEELSRRVQARAIEARLETLKARLQGTT